MTKKYLNPPVIEAICEVRFTQSTDWDITIPGLLSKYLNQFPQKEQRIRREVSLIPTPNGMEQTLIEDPVMFFYAEDRHSFVLVGDRRFSLHFSPPYPAWKNILPVIQRIWIDLLEILKGPVQIERIGVRYINRLNIPENFVDLGDYFYFRPETGKVFDGAMNMFNLVATTRLEDGRDEYRVQFGNTVPDHEENLAFLLDLDYAMSRADGIQPEAVLEWINSAHSHCERIFESCITDRTRALFGEVRDE